MEAFVPSWAGRAGARVDQAWEDTPASASSWLPLCCTLSVPLSPMEKQEPFGQGFWAP